MKTRPHPSTKPYFPCLSCPDFGKQCSGKSTRNMTIKEWCEFLRDVKDVRRARGDLITNQQIAELVPASLSTIESIMAIRIDRDITREMARRIEVVVIGTDAEMPCYYLYSDAKLLAQLAELQKQVEFLQNENELKNKLLTKLL